MATTVAMSVSSFCRRRRRRKEKNPISTKSHQIITFLRSLARSPPLLCARTSPSLAAEHFVGNPNGLDSLLLAILPAGCGIKMVFYGSLFCARSSARRVNAWKNFSWLLKMATQNDGIVCWLAVHSSLLCAAFWADA